MGTPIGGFPPRYLGLEQSLDRVPELVHSRLFYDFLSCPSGFIDSRIVVPLFCVYHINCNHLDFDLAIRRSKGLGEMQACREYS